MLEARQLLAADAMPGLGCVPAMGDVLALSGFNGSWTTGDAPVGAAMTGELGAGEPVASYAMLAETLVAEGEPETSNGRVGRREDKTPVPFPLEAVEPLGSLVYAGAMERAIDFRGNIDRYLIPAGPGQAVSVFFEGDAPLRGSLRLYVVAADYTSGVQRLVGSADAMVAGAPLEIRVDDTHGQLKFGQTRPETYLLTVAGMGITTGDYSLRVVLNATVENEQLGGAANDTPATSQNLDRSFQALYGPYGRSRTAQPERAAVLGELPGGSTTVPGYLENQTTFDSSFFPFSIGGLGVETQRYQQIFAASEFSQSGIIDELRFRRSTFQEPFLNNDLDVKISLGYSATTTFNFSAVFAENVGAGFATVFDGVFSLSSTGTGSPNPFDVVLDVADTFHYDPALGDLLVEYEVRNAPTVGFLDAAWAFGRMITISSNALDEPTGQANSQGLITQFGFVSDEVDYYNFDLKTGQSATLALTSLNGRELNLSLHAPDGTLVAMGVERSNNVSELIGNFIATQSGKYLVKVEGAAPGLYSLVITRNAEFENEDNNSFESAQPIFSQELVARRWVHGHLEEEPTRLFSVHAGGVITELDPTSGVVINTLSTAVPTGSGDEGFAYDGSSLYLTTTFDNGKLFKIDPDTGEVLNTYNVGSTGDFLDGLAALDGLIYISNASTNEIYVFDPTEEAFLPPVSPSVGLRGGLAAISEPNGLIATTTNNEVVELDPKTGEIRNVFFPSTNSFFTSVAVLDGEIYLGSYGGEVTVYSRSGEWQRSFTAPFLMGGLAGDAFVKRPQSDFYEIVVDGRKTVQIESMLPKFESGESSSGLDPLIRLYDADRNLLAWDDNSAADGRNASLTYKVPENQGGRFFVEVTASGDTAVATYGEYLLSIKSSTAVLPAFEVTSINPADARAIRGPITELIVQFGNNINLSTLQASDVLVDGIEASGINLIDGQTVRFAIAQELPDGPHSVAIAAGAVVDIHGTSLAAFDSTFVVDMTPPQVIATTPNEGGAVAEGPVVIVLTFSEPMEPVVPEFGVPAYGQFLFSFNLSTGWEWSDDNTQLTLTFENLREDDYQLQLPWELLRDQVGIVLDGDYDGVEGGQFNLFFSVDADTRSLTGPLTAVQPLGSLVYQTQQPTRGVLNASDGVFSNGDTDEWTVELEAGQTLTVVLNPYFAQIGTLEVVGPDGSVVGGGTGTIEGQSLLVQTVPVVEQGTYTLRVGGEFSVPGPYDFTLTLNAALETEVYGGPTNDALASAQSLSASFVELADGATRGAVLGQTDGAGEFAATAVDFGFTDISTTGTGILQGSDDGSWFLGSGDLEGFEIVLAGMTFNQLEISANGFLNLYSNDGTGAVNALSRDLVIFGSEAASVYWQVIGSGDEQQLVVQWHEVGFFGYPDADPITFQVVLSEADSSVRLNYLDLQTSEEFLTEGVNSSVGLFLYSYVTGQSFNVDLPTFDAPNEFVGTGRSTVIAAEEGTADYYSLELNAGESVAVAVKALSTIDGLIVQLQDADGQVLAEGVPGGSNVDVVINSFVAPATGLYYVVVSSDAVGDYNVVVTRAATLDAEGNNSLDSAQPLDASAGVALGHVWGKLPAEIGLVANDGNKSVTLFDAVTDTIIGSVQIPTSAPAFGDVEIHAALGLGFVTDFFGSVWVIDLEQGKLAEGINQIFVWTNALDLTLTADGKYLIVSDGSNIQPLSVIDVETRTQIGVFDWSSDHNSVDVLADGSLLVTSRRNENVRRFMIDDNGNMSDTGEILAASGPVNVLGAPDAQTGVVVGFNQITSFAVDGMTLLSSRPIPHPSSNQQSAVFSPDGTRLYVRSDGLGNSGFIDMWGYDPLTGEFSLEPLITISGIDNDPLGPLPDRINVYFGIDQITVSTDGSKLYVPQNDSIDVYDASTGELISSMSDDSIDLALGVKVVELTKPAEVDMYTFQVAEMGEAFVIQSSTPTIGMSGAGNRLDPMLTVLDPDGNIVAFDDNSAADGKNAFLQFIAPSPGTYTVVVSAATSQAGEYVLSVTPSAVPLSKRLAAGGVVAGYPENDSKAFHSQAIDHALFQPSSSRGAVGLQSQVVDELFSDWGQTAWGSSGLGRIASQGLVASQGQLASPGLVASPGLALTLRSHPGSFAEASVRDGIFSESGRESKRSHRAALFADLAAQLFEPLD